MVKNLSLPLAVSWLFLSLWRCTDAYILASQSDLSLSLTDVTTGVSPVLTLFLNEKVVVSVDGIKWEGAANSSSTVLEFTTVVDGNVFAQGKINLPESALELPYSVDVGEIYTSKSGPTTIEVTLRASESSLSTSLTIQSFKSWVSFTPIIVVIILGLLTRQVEVSLVLGIFVGACIITGGVRGGFKTTIDTYLLDAASNLSHVYT